MEYKVYYNANEIQATYKHQEQNLFSDLNTISKKVKEENMEDPNNINKYIIQDYFPMDNEESDPRTK